MSVFDLIILAILIALTLRGIMKGMVSQIVSVGSLFVCWIVASRFAFVIAPSIPAEEPWNKIGAMIVLFIVTMIAIRFVHGYLEKKLKDWHLDGLNKYLGAGLGFVKGLLVCMVLTFFAVMLSETTREVVFQSKSGRHLANLIAKTGTFIPSDSCELLRTQIATFNAKVNGTSVESEGSENDHMQAMLAAKDSTNEESFSDALQGGTKIGELFSRSNAVLDELQSLRDDFHQETSGAASLLDAIGKWWNGSGNDEKATTETSVPSGKTASSVLFSGLENPIPEEPAKLPSTQNETLSSPPAPTAFHETAPPSSEMFRSSSIDPVPLVEQAPQTVSSPTASTTSPNTAYREETLFRATTPSYTPPSAEELTALLPSDTTGSQASPIASSPLIDPIASGAMSIPRSSSSFRLLRSSDNSRSSERLLDSTQSTGSVAPATVFSNRSK